MFLAYPFILKTYLAFFKFSLIPVGFLWIQTRGICYFFRKIKTFIPPFPTKQRVHKGPLHPWSVGWQVGKMWNAIVRGNHLSVYEVIKSMIRRCTLKLFKRSKDSYMGHFHALNLSWVLHSLGEAEWSVGNWSPVSLK